MRLSDKAGGKPPKAQRRKTLTPRNAAKAARHRAAVTADLQEQLDQRTRELDEALQQQTATSEVLRVISTSAGELQPVFNAMLENATRTCAAKFGILYQCEGDALRTVATHGAPQSFVEERQRNPIISPNPDTTLGRALSTKQPVQIADIRAEIMDFDARAAQLPKLAGARTVLAVPMVKKSELLGAILIYGQEVRLFTDKQIELVTTFADQAVIAIENARLFNEVLAKTRDLSEALTYQTGSSNILSVIASSPTDVGPVLKAIVDSACELCEAYDAIITLKDGNEIVLRAHHGPIAMNRERWANDRTSLSGRAIADRLPVHLRDVLSDEGAEFPIAQAMSRLDGVGSMLSVPMILDDNAIGTIVLRRIEVNPFSDKQIALLQTFADQAVIAIGNVRTFEQVQQRTRELSRSLEELRTAQDRLIQTEKLASLGQLTAGIAHEIKNPLNFVNNFSELSAELTDELNAALRPVLMDSKVREEVDELTGLLKDNLEKVVQHGKRADSIVKNMLLHSREGSREHRPADINSLLDESLNLAYHGARAEKGEFNIALQRDFDADAGTIEVFPQEITRAFLNLIANGVYAANRRKAEDKEPGFEPTLRATTKNHGTTVEIRIRDNGTGIPADVREKMFNPFFTTKPTGEGTGLGLSMTHDIIVKQHGGRIDVETEPGSFTEFIITLPRDNGTAAGQKSE